MRSAPSSAWEGRATAASAAANSRKLKADPILGDISTFLPDRLPMAGYPGGAKSKPFGNTCGCYVFAGPDVHSRDDSGRRSPGARGDRLAPRAPAGALDGREHRDLLAGGPPRP